MISTDQIKVTDQGSGFTVGEIISTPYEELNYLRSGEIVALFDGIDSAIDYISKLKVKNSGSSGRFEAGFHTFQTFEETIQEFRNNPEKLVNFDPSEMRIKDNNEAGSEVDYDVTGDYIDMGRFMEGVPESVGTMHMGNARNRRVNLTVHVNYSGGTGPDVIAHRSQRIIRLVDALEAGGVRVKITAINSNSCEHMEVVVKRHEEPLTLTDLAVVTHPDWLRRLVFRVAEQSKTWSYGYGSSQVFTERVKARSLEAEQLNDETGIFIGNDMDYKSQIDARFDELERLLLWEMSKAIPEISSIKASGRGIYFEANGARSDAEIQSEGQDAF